MATLSLRSFVSSFSLDSNQHVHVFLDSFAQLQWCSNTLVAGAGDKSDNANDKSYSFG